MHYVTVIRGLPIYFLGINMPSHGSLTKAGKVRDLHKNLRRWRKKRGKLFRKEGRPSPRLRRRKQFQALLKRK